MIRILESAYEDLVNLDAVHASFGGKEPFPSEAVLEKLELLDEFPLIGPIHHDVFLAQRGFRKLIVGRWTVVYRLDDQIPTVYRVFHQHARMSYGGLDQG